MTNLEHYNFNLPPELIASEPASPRDSARLFVYDTSINAVMFDTFKNLHKFLPRNAHLVFNDTKVVPARLWLKKETGGKIEVLLMMNELQKGEKLLKGIVDRKLVVGAKLFFETGAFLEVVRQDEQFFFFKPSVTLTEIFVLLTQEGHTPIPPYIKNTKLTEGKLREKYQSMFAKHPASVAAPTASLHFTPRVMKLLEEEVGATHSFVTLHVGSGTFAPINKHNFETKKLFTEHCAITPAQANTLNKAIAHDSVIIPVGTTAMRTLESFASPYNNNWHVDPGMKATNIFIYPPYDFKIAGGMLTNFHIPQSSLMLLVDAFLEHKKAKRRIGDLYKIAMEKKFRFYSFGDAMLII